MILKRTSKLMVMFFSMVIVLASCKDQAKMDAEKKAEEEKIAMEEAESAKMKEEARKKEMMATSITAVASGNEELSTLVAAVKAADLAPMLSEEGSYTVFAPTNNAFEKLPKKMSVEELLKPENKETLKSVLQYHVVLGEITSGKLVQAIEGADGSYSFKTAAGGELIASMDGEQLIIKDEKGNKTQVVLGNVEASNGIVHIVNDVLLAK